MPLSIAYLLKSLPGTFDPDLLDRKNPYRDERLLPSNKLIMCEGSNHD